MKKLTAMAAAITVVLASYILSPFLALAQMKYHLDHKNGHEFSEFIDFDKVKLNLKARLISEMPKPDPNNPWERLGSVMALAVIDPIVNNMINPEFIAKQLEDSKGNSRKNSYSFSYESLNCLNISVNDTIEATMRRYGFFSWKVTDVVIIDKD